MNIKQHTIKETVSVSGVGLHTGHHVTLRFLPAEPGHGIKFQRVDLEDKPIIEADVDNVIDISRGTTIAKGEARVSTIEHTLAALVGLQIDNILIEVDGPETPILDGSAVQFIEALESVGLEEQNALREYYEIKESISYSDPERDVDMTILPLDDYRVTVMVDYNSPVLGSQHASLNNIKDFKQEISSCRTFCFLHELEQLHKQGLVRGGDLNNAIVVVDKVVNDNELDDLAKLFNKEKVEVKAEGILNNIELRYKNEPARHKLLDVVGDLALVGKPLKGQVMAARPGHKSNVAFAKKIKDSMRKSRKQAPKYDAKATPLFNAQQVYQALPHEFPFKLVDKIVSLDQDSVVGVKNVTINEPIFQGHFPDNPIFPGVLLLETIAQVGGIFILNTVEDPENYITLFMGVDKCKFRKPVLPGDTVVIKCTLLAPIKRGIAHMHGQAFVGDNLVCETEILASIVRRKKEE